MNVNDETESSVYSILTKLIIFSIVFAVIIICVRWFFTIKKKNNIGYFYDESGNPAEKARVVYIQ